jgi:hypothetical protein
LASEQNDAVVIAQHPIPVVARLNPGAPDLPEARDVPDDFQGS